VPLYAYQELVKSHLLNGRPVVLQAPTGSGKTRAALAPFIEAFFDLPDDAFPKQCLYSVPMRVLAGQFYREYHHLAERYERIHRRSLDVRIQTGERPEDPQLDGRPGFCHPRPDLEQRAGRALQPVHRQGQRERGRRARLLPGVR
jgi:CRISPR-associated endonuclease/helicase Cas3